MGAWKWALLQQVTRQSVHKWVSRYRRRSVPAALVDAPKSRRPRKANKSAETLLQALMIIPPERWPRLVEHEFDFVKWGFADVGLSTAPLTAPCVGQERAARWGNPACHLRRFLKGGKMVVVKLIRCAAVKRTVRTLSVVECQIRQGTNAERHRMDRLTAGGLRS